MCHHYVDVNSFFFLSFVITKIPITMYFNNYLITLIACTVQRNNSYIITYALISHENDDAMYTLYINVYCRLAVHI